MKKIWFPEDDTPHIIPADAVAVIIGFQNWKQADQFGDTGYDITLPGGSGYFIPKDQVITFTDIRSDGSESYFMVLCIAVTKWRRINGMTLEYELPLGYAELTARTSMRLVYGYCIDDDIDDDTDDIKHLEEENEE